MPDDTTLNAENLNLFYIGKSKFGSPNDWVSASLEHGLEAIGNEGEQPVQDHTVIIVYELWIWAQEKNEVKNKECTFDDGRRKALLSGKGELFVPDAYDGSNQYKIEVDKIIEPSCLICMNQYQWNRQQLKRDAQSNKHLLSPVRATLNYRFPEVDQGKDDRQTDEQIHQNGQHMQKEVIGR